MDGSNMKPMKYVRPVVVAAALACGGVAGMATVNPVAAAQQAPGASSAAPLVLDGTTHPNDRVDLKPQLLGLVKELPVKEGDVVKQGDLLIQQDDAIEQAALKALQLEADSKIRVEAAIADEKVKRVELQRYKEMEANNATSASEVEKAELNLIFAEKQIGLAELENAKAKAEAERQRLRVEQMKLLSPFDGIVESIKTSAGGVIDPDNVAISLVQINPLKVEVHAPAEAVQGLKKGDKLQVRYRLDGPDAPWQEAEVSYLAPVARAGAGSLRAVHLKLPNDAGREAGLWVEVRFPPAGGVAGSNQAAPERAAGAGR
jgi:membrane fusion protein (multidrug efflux system)